MSIRLERAPNGYYCPDDPGEPFGDKRWSVSDTEARLLSELFAGKNVLEIGTGLGISARKMAETAKCVHTVDVDAWVKENVLPSLPHNVIFYDNIKNVPGSLDGAFIDGLHVYKQVMEDIVNARNMVKKGGLIILHDYHIDDVYNAIMDCNMNCIEIKTFAGMALYWND